jgi:hypothetical protein
MFHKAVCAQALRQAIFHPADETHDDAVKIPQGEQDGCRARFEFSDSFAARVQLTAQAPANRCAQAVRDPSAEVMPNAGARSRELIPLALARPALRRGPHEDEMDDEAGKQIQPVLDKSLHALWQAPQVRHVLQHLRQPHSGAKRAALQTFL